MQTILYKWGEAILIGGVSLALWSLSIGSMIAQESGRQEYVKRRDRGINLDNWESLPWIMFGDSWEKGFYGAASQNIRDK